MTCCFKFQVSVFWNTDWRNCNILKNLFHTIVTSSEPVLSFVEMRTNEKVFTQSYTEFFLKWIALREKHGDAALLRGKEIEGEREKGWWGELEIERWGKRMKRDFFNWNDINKNCKKEFPPWGGLGRCLDGLMCCFRFQVCNWFLCLNLNLPLNLIFKKDFT